MRYLSKRFVAFPPISFLRAAVPKRDYVVHVSDDDCVVREVKQIGAFAENFVCVS
jgi:hypothetical protein